MSSEVEFVLYLNGEFHTHLWSSEDYSDRPEPYRMHNHTLWTVYQIMRNRDHELTICDKDKNVLCTLHTETEFLDWVKKTYNAFYELDRRSPTGMPHPGDKLKKN
jgi:hypothetical protein